MRSSRQHSRVTALKHGLCPLGKQSVNASRCVTATSKPHYHFCGGTVLHFISSVDQIQQGNLKKLWFSKKKRAKIDIRWYFLCCRISLLIVIRVNTCTPWSIIPFFPNPYVAASSFLWSFGEKDNPLHGRASYCLTIWSILKEFDIFMKTFLTVESRDHLRMCLSEIAQACQVSPVCEIKLATVFIDLSCY